MAKVPAGVLACCAVAAVALTHRVAWSCLPQGSSNATYTLPPGVKPLPLIMMIPGVKKVGVPRRMVGPAGGTAVLDAARGRYLAGGPGDHVGRDGQLGARPSWERVYEGGIDARLGVSGERSGETTRVVTFYRPRAGEQPPAWFAWWVGTKTGRVYQSAMVSGLQYVVQTNTDFNGTFTIKPPTGA